MVDFIDYMFQTHPVWSILILTGLFILVMSLKEWYSDFMDAVDSLEHLSPNLEEIDLEWKEN